MYPGADGTASVYEDDGRTFDYRKGELMRVQIAWRDATRVLTLRLAAGSRMLEPARRTLEVRIAGSTAVRRVTFEGRPVTLKL